LTRWGNIKEVDKKKKQRVGDIGKEPGKKEKTKEKNGGDTRRVLHRPKKGKKRGSEDKGGLGPTDREGVWGEG